MGSPNSTVNGLSDIGQVRDENEDHLEMYSHPVEPFSFVIVADGMGGYTGGARASSLATQKLKEALIGLISNDFLGCSPLQQIAIIRMQLNKGIQQANRAILDEKQCTKGFVHMGTTIVCVAIWQEQLVVAHVGDSRAYQWNKFGICPITKDHSLVQSMIDEGQLTEDQARTCDVRNQLTRAIGIEEDLDVTIQERTLVGDNTFLLCSDGLTEYLEDYDIERILASQSTNLENCYRLVDEANSRGGKDNVTVAIMEFRAPASAEQHEKFTSIDTKTPQPLIVDAYADITTPGNVNHDRTQQNEGLKRFLSANTVDGDVTTPVPKKK
ncbi:MAG: serine/threonine protein phosphatase PrpC [Flavobacteriales bacterium]|jgi:serine/threonine protein phosphatase PrpC